MRLRWTNCDRLSALNSEVANGKTSASADIEEHELIVRLRCHTASVFGLRRREGNDLER